MYGELVPIGGGDPIPLTKTTLVLGRRESCDIVLRFANVSGNHCRLTVEQGYWYVQDLNTSNGTRVNTNRRITTKKRLDPGDMLTVAHKHQYKVQYSPVDLGATGPPPSEEEEEVQDVMSKSLLDRAGLSRKPDPNRRYNPANDAPGQLRKKTDDD